MKPRFMTQEDQCDIHGTPSAIHSDSGLSRQNNVRLGCRRWSAEGLAILGEALHESSLREEELPVFHTHEAIQAIGLPGWIMAELGLPDLAPSPRFIGYPLRAEQSFATQMSVSSPEVLTERIESSEILAILGCPKARQQHPRLPLWMKPVAAVSGVRAIDLRGDDELLRLACLPGIDEM